MRNRKRLFILIALASVLVIASVVTMYLMYTPAPHPPLRQIERIAGIKFPAGSKVIGSHGRWFMEIGVYAKVEIDKQHLQSFTRPLGKSQKIDDEALFRIKKLKRNPDWDWWDADKISNPVYYKSMYTEEATRRNGYRLLIDEPGGSKANVYLYYYNY